MKKELGDKIAEIRKTRGLSQQELADKAGVSLRTIQRLEKNQNEPQGHTLKQICNVLEVPVEDLLDYGKSENRKYLLLLHLSPLSMFFFPLGNVILPLIIWLTQKDKIAGMNESGKNLIQFQVVMTIIFCIAMIVYFMSILEVFTKPNLNWFIAGWFIIGVIYPIISTMLTYRGQTLKPYPRLIPFKF